MLFRYRAFISYSRYDRRLANRLRRKFESYKLPRGLEQFNKAPLVNGKKNTKLGRIFLDYDELAATELGPAINGALDDSENFIVIASRYAAESKWVNKEVSYFKNRSNRPIFALIRSGAPNVPNNECFPKELRDLDSAR